LLLLTTDPTIVVVAAVVAAMAGCLAVSGVRVHVDPSKAVRRTPDRPLEALLGGLSELRHNTDAAVVIGCFIAQLLVRGFLTVLLVSVSFDLLELGNSGVGWLVAALGVGGITGGVYAVTLTGRRQLGRPFAFALVLWGGPIALMGLVPSTPVVIAALLTIGVGNAILDVSGFTLVQRLAADRTLGRVFGVLFTFGIAIGGFGSLVAPRLVSAIGLRPVLILVGAVLPLLAVILLPRFRTIDQHALLPAELLELFSGISLFAPLPPTTIEKIAGRCTMTDLPAGSVIIREGEHGDCFYAIVRGAAEVRRGTVVKRTYGPGDHFGEIALLRDINRTATVIALSDIRLAMLGTAEFLDALASSDAAYGIAWRSTAAMIDDHPAPAPL
jgi:MFS family permease